jgi:hypothetical protein
MEANTPEQKPKTDNELIAEFMKNHAINSPHLRTAKELENTYDYSWDWLMPVVEKIEGIYKTNFPPDFVHRILTKQPTLVDKYMDVIALPLATPINEVHKAVVDFIKWHNPQNNG